MNHAGDAAGVEAGQRWVAGRRRKPLAIFAGWSLGAQPTGRLVRLADGQFLLPGLVDLHIHAPQWPQMGKALDVPLEVWLQKYTFPLEARYADVDYAREVYADLVDNLLANGTTTAAVYCSVHPQSAEAFFAESQRRNTRMIAGKVMMDRNAPQALTDTAESGYRDSKALIARWHGKGRQLYAITPRFAITSTPEQMAAAGRLPSREELP